MEIKKLDIDLSTDGWEVSGGRSGNVWGQVPTNNLPLDQIEKSISEGKMPSIWTCYDKVIYVFDENGKLLPLDRKKLPKTMSATFKPTFSKYSAIAENMAMRITAELDMPTSFNYLVSFDADEYPQIITNFQTKSNAERVQKIGIVSVDFLQVVALDREIEEEVRVVRNGKIDWEKQTRNYSCDELVYFADIMNIAKSMQSLSGSNFSIKNWLKSIDMLAERYVPDFPKDKLKHQIEKINSRAVRSFLTREFLGDCDFTDLNGGWVINNDAQILRYAPNFDFGESFNALITTKLDYMPPEKELAEILKWDPTYIEKKQKKAKEVSVEAISQMYASDASKENLRFVLENYPNEVNEFITNLNKAISEGALDKIVDSYTEMTNNGQPLLTKEEAQMFKDYLNGRAKWLNILAEHYKKKDEKEKIK